MSPYVLLLHSPAPRVLDVDDRGMASSNRRRIKNDIHKLLMDVKIFDDDPLGQVEKEG